MHVRVLDVLHQIGFYGVYRCGRLVYDCHLITALVERWRPETHTFHFRVGEATITLEDVQIIWALSIDGLPVTGLDIERSTEEWQIYCREYLGFSPDEEAFKGSRLHTHAIMNFIRTIEITHDTPRPTVVQYTRCIAMLLLGGLMCPDSSGNMVPLLYLSKLERDKCRQKLQLGQCCPCIFIPGIMSCQSQRQSGNWWCIATATATPYGAIWNCRHNFTRIERTTVRVIRDILDNMQEDQFIWQPYDMDSDRIMAYVADFTPELLGRTTHTHIRRWQRRRNTIVNRPPISNERHTERGYWEWYNNITRRFVSSSTSRRVESGYQPGDGCMRDIVLVRLQRIHLKITMFLNRQQDDWFQSAPYMPSHAESYSAHVDLDLGLGVNQSYAPEYNVSPIPFPSFSAYRDQVESSSATTSSRLHINDDDDDNEQNEPTQNIVEEIRRPRRQRHRRNCGTGGHF
ncbi:UNVERIFIED_CONTAM: Serine/threonine-protein phosphatase 7 long form [Sesamum radiatum]|uniref:Serine/threonine-protein phosphatase 7 long form n=1 Tax=Sesamum radiatum TaxID=300843 RepID=A0AAW2VZS9_SESRA